MRYVIHSLGIILVLGCSHMTPEGYEQAISHAHGKDIQRIILAVGPPMQTYRVPGDRHLKAYDFVTYRGWRAPMVNWGSMGPNYDFAGPFCLTSLYTDEDGRVVGHRFQGVLCKAKPEPEPKEIWVYQGTEDITAEERQKEVDALFVDFESTKKREPVFIDCGKKTALECGDSEAKARGK